MALLERHFCLEFRQDIRVLRENVPSYSFQPMAPELAFPPLLQTGTYGTASIKSKVKSPVLFLFHVRVPLLRSYSAASRHFYGPPDVAVTLSLARNEQIARDSVRESLGKKFARTKPVQSATRIPWNALCRERNKRTSHMQMHLAPTTAYLRIREIFREKYYYHGQNCGLFKYSLTPSQCCQLFIYSEENWNILWVLFLCNPRNNSEAVKEFFNDRYLTLNMKVYRWKNKLKNNNTY